MKRTLTLALAALAIASTAVAFAADNSLGTWKLNVSKSKYSPGPLPVKSLSATREAAGDGVKVTTTGERSDGSSINTASLHRKGLAHAIVGRVRCVYETFSIRR